MSAVRQESATLESMKQKLKEFEQLKLRVPALESELAQVKKENAEVIDTKNEQDKVVSQLRLDMQRLNDLYNTERKQHLEVKHVQLRQEQELVTATKLIDQLKSTAQDSNALEKKNKDLHREVTLLQQRLEEEKAAVARSFQMLEQQHDEAEKVKAELSQHFWNLSEELKANKNRLEESESLRHRLESSLGCIDEAFNEALETSAMAAADNYSLQVEGLNRLVQEEQRHEADTKALRSTVQELRCRIAEKEEARKDMEKQVAQLRQESSSIMASHADQMQAMSDKNKELLASEVRLCHKIEAMARASQNMEKLLAQQKTDNERLEETTDALRREVDALTAARDAAVAASASTSTHTTALEEQLKEAHAKQWAVMQAMKERELQAEEEVRELQEAVRDTEQRLAEMESKKDKIEEMCQAEISQVSHMSNVLKTELEKRLDELSRCGQERDALRAERDRLQGTVETLTGDMKKREKIFQHALDTDRAKIQQEMKAKNNRIRNLEAEKQELLGETSQLMAQLSAEQKAKSNTDRNISEGNKALAAAQEEIKSLRLDNTRLTRDGQESTKRERDLQDKLSDMEGQFRLDISRLDAIVKESRKTAAQQVGELTTKCQSLCDELAEERKHKSDLQNSERQAVMNADKYSTELKQLRTEHEDFQMNAAKEIAAAKREAQNTLGKVKTLADIKAKMEMELVTLRMERARAGSEVTQLLDKIKGLEEKCSTLETDLSNTTDELDKMTASCRRSKASVGDLESNLQRHVKMLSKATEEIERLEKHSFMEGKKLRTNLNSANRKLQEQSDIIAKLTMEVESSAANFSKLQATTNETISGLMEELKRTEDALSKERSSNSQEMGKAHQRISGLQSQLESFKDSMNEKLIQTESDRSDKQVMLLQLNSEINRLKQLNDGKDSRIDDLEKQHQEDRLKLQELRSKVTNLESELSEVRIELAKSDKKQRLLSVKLQKDGSSPSRQYEDTWTGGYGVGGGGNGEDAHSQKDFDSKNRMYLQDDDEYVGIKSKYSGGNYDDIRDGADAGTDDVYGGTYDPYQNGDSAGDEYHGHYSSAAVATIDASPINSGRGDTEGCTNDDDYVDEEAFQRAIAAAGTNVPTYGRVASASDIFAASNSALHGHPYGQDNRGGGGGNRRDRDSLLEGEGAGEGEDPSSIAASIARTQRFLQRRGKGGSMSSDGNPLGANGSAGIGGSDEEDYQSRSRKPKSRSNSRQGGSSKRAEAACGSGGSKVSVPRGSDGGRQVSGATYLHDDNNDSNDENDFAFGAPMLMPATPPVIGNGGSLTFAGLSGDDDKVPLSRESTRSLPVRGSEGFIAAEGGSTGTSKSGSGPRSKSSSSKKRNKASAVGSAGSGGSNKRGGDDSAGKSNGGGNCSGGDGGIFPRISPLRKGSSWKGDA